MAREEVGAVGISADKNREVTVIFSPGFVFCFVFSTKKLCLVLCRKKMQNMRSSG